MQADAAAASPAAAPAAAASQAEGGRLQELQALLERQNTEIEKLTKELEAVKVGDVGLAWGWCVGAEECVCMRVFCGGVG